MDSARHRSTPWIDTTRPTPPRHPQRRAPVLRVITVLGETLTPGPPSVGHEGLREGAHAFREGWAARDHGACDTLRRMRSVK